MLYKKYNDYFDGSLHIGELNYSLVEENKETDNVELKYVEMLNTRGNM